MSFASPTHGPMLWPSTFVSPFSREGPAFAQHVAGNIPVSSTYPAANRAHYFPIYVPRPITVYRFFWLNGATASTDNVQVGLYNEDFTSHTLGTSTLAAGANVCQFDNVTDFGVQPGRYWLALWCNGTTTTIFRSANAAFDHARHLDEDSLTGGLPSTATPTQSAATYMPVFGFTTIASP